jgi:opacity protein-like surface antigen
VSATLLIDLASFNLQATYSRRQSTTSGAGLASSLDRFYSEVEFAPPNQRWSTFVAGSWDRREILTEATVVDFTVVAGAGGAAERSIAFTRNDNQAERRESLTAIAGVRTAFTRNQAATFEFRYRRTQGRDQGVSQPSADIFFAVVTFAYTLDPLHF